MWQRQLPEPLEEKLGMRLEKMWEAALERDWEAIWERLLVGGFLEPCLENKRADCVNNEWELLEHGCNAVRIYLFMR